MARPMKCRRICSVPEHVVFSPDNSCEEQVILGMDEYEAIRLLDLEGFTQEQCARQMNVARPTITLIYENARRKIAEALIGCKQLVIEGGNVVVCPNASENCCGRCGKDECGNCKRNCRMRMR